MNKQCKHIKSDKTQCKGIMLLKDGFCMIHSPTVKVDKKKVDKEKAEIVREFKLPTQSPLKQVRKFCLDCCGDSWRDTQFCASIDCALWFFRFGKAPQAFVRSKGKNYARLFNKKNFGEDKRYDSDTEVETLRV